MFTISLQGCIVSGMKLNKTHQNYLPDNTITGSISPVEISSSNPIENSDQRIISDKISRIASDKDIPIALNWDNKETGSQGVINNISQLRKNKQICRNFQTTRAAFDGVLLYNGQICQVSTNQWALTAFNVVE